MHFLGLGWLFSKAIYTINFILYRLAAWTGTLYLYRKARRSGKKLYYVYSVLVYAASWATVLFFSATCWRWLQHLGSLRTHLAEFIRYRYQ